jgi:two-component system CheB/CheR fusion protein
MTACRAARSRPARSTSCFRSPRFRRRWPRYGERRTAREAPSDRAPPECHDWLPEIIELLRTKTAHDFTLYKPGTLQRRIERRMAMAAIETDDMDAISTSAARPGELDLLAKDLLINVTSFFRDPEVFDLLAETIIPDLVRNQPPDQPLRIWIAGCSTGEETYSLAMLFREQITRRSATSSCRSSPPTSIRTRSRRAREGPLSRNDRGGRVAGRLARFFSKEDHGYRILPELRAAVVFTVQDVLADPPFSRLDLVSCRNLLIYLRPEAQAKVISLFHFALREGGVLLLGSSRRSATPTAASR